MRGSFGEIPEELKSLTRISPSGLIEFAKSPKHYHFKYIKKGYVEPSKSMELGTAAHRAVLEPDLFETEYVKKPSPEDHEGCLVTADDIKNELIKLGLPVSGVKAVLTERLRSNSPEAKFFDDILREAIGDKKVLTESEYETCIEIVNSIKESEQIHNLIQGCEKEQSCWWEHSRTGTIINMRLDAFKRMKDGSIIAIDLKTVRSAAKRQFERQIWENWMFIQAAMYADGIEQITGNKCEHFGWLAAENSYPYSVEFYAADFGLLEAGRQTYNKLLDQFLECKRINKWPSANGGKITNVSFPHWAWDKLVEWNNDQL